MNPVLAAGKIVLHAAQVSAFMSAAAITLVIAGIRGGKTHVGALKTLFYALLHPCREDEVHLVASPTFPMSRVPVAKIFTMLYDNSVFPWNPLIRYRKSDRVFELRAAGGGITRVQVVSLHDPDKIRGIKALSAWIDEGAYVSEEAWQIVQGRLADSAGPCWITTTPAGYNWVYDLYERALEEKRDGIPVQARSIRVVHFSSLQNTFIKDKSGFDRLVQGYDERTYKQEVDARFVRMRGLIYHPFSRAANLKIGRINPLAPLWVGQDFNVDPMSSVIAQPFRVPGGKYEGAHIKSERRAPDSDTFGLVRFLDEFIAEHRIPKDRVTIFADASGRSRSTSGKSDFFILREAGYEVKAPPRNPLVKDRINCVNGLLRPMPSVCAHPRLLVDPSCVGVIESFEKQIWKPESDPPEPDKTQGFDHYMDATGYMCWANWPLKHSSRLPRRAA